MFPLSQPDTDSECVYESGFKRDAVSFIKWWKDGCLYHAHLNTLHHVEHRLFHVICNH